MNLSFARTTLLVLFSLSMMVDTSDAFAQGGLFGDSVKEGGSKGYSKSKKEEEPSDGTDVQPLPQQSMNLLSDLASDVIEDALSGGDGTGETDQAEGGDTTTTTTITAATTSTDAESGTRKKKRRNLLRGAK